MKALMVALMGHLVYAVTLSAVAGAPFQKCA